MERLSTDEGRRSAPLAGERLAILVLLVLLSAAGWALLLRQTTMGMDGAGPTMGTGMGLGPGSGVEGAEESRRTNDRKGPN